MRIQGRADVVVVGGGLTGIVSALRLASEGASVLVVDQAVPQAEGRIGGFARFSGAKFSLPPAGMGLLPVAGSDERFRSTIDSVLRILRMDRSMALPSFDHAEREGLALRRYESIVLTPVQVSDLLDHLAARLSAEAKLLQGRATNLRRWDGAWCVEVTTSNATVQLLTDAVFYAAGRLSDDFLLRAGAEPRDGKGLDVGVRLEFVNKEALSVLRGFGPDAKILHNECRTFCLNSPGQIYRYPFENLTIPGGVVASPETLTGNVGILLRLGNKKESLEAILRKSAGVEAALLAESAKISTERKPTIPPVLVSVFGEKSCGELQSFANQLHLEGLIDFASEHRIHMPLLDWHWKTFALPASHRTSLSNVFALGDSSGHARGLLQACISGWLAAEEYLC